MKSDRKEKANLMNHTRLLRGQHTARLLRKLLPLLSLLLWAMFPSPARAATWALLIGIDQYRFNNQIANLGAAANDARSLKAVLLQRMKVPEDHIILLTSDGPVKPDRSEIVNALSRLRQNVQPTDTVYIFFAGHGVDVGGKSYLLPYDASGLGNDELTLTSLPTEVFAGLLSRVNAQAMVMIFDMCRSNPRANQRDALAQNKLTAATARSIDFSRKTPAPAPGKATHQPIIVTLFACSPDERSYEWTDRKRGYFSYYLTQGLSGAAAQNGAVTVGSLTEYLTREVSQRVSTNEGAHQTPYPEVSGPNAQQFVLTKVTGDPGATPVTEPSDTTASNPTTDTTATHSTDTTTTATAGNARLEFYTNNPGLAATVDGQSILETPYQTQVDAGSKRSVDVQLKLKGYRERRVGFPLEPGAQAWQQLYIGDGVLDCRFPPIDEFRQVKAQVFTGKLGDKEIVAGDWRLENVTLEEADTFTQRLFPAKKTVGVTGADQRLVVIRGRLRGTISERRPIYFVRVEPGETPFPYDTTALADNAGNHYPLIAHDIATDRDKDGHPMPFAVLKQNDRRDFALVFRVPRTVKREDMAQLALTLLTPDDPANNRTEVTVALARK